MVISILMLFEQIV